MTSRSASASAFLLAIASAVLGLASSAFAQSTASMQPTDPPPPPPATAAADPSSPSSRSAELAPGWIVHIEPRAWWVSPSGKLRMPSSSSSSSSGGDRVRLEDLNLDAPNIEPAGEIRIRADRFSLIFDGMVYESERETIAESAFQLGEVSFPAGEVFESTFDFYAFDILAGYQLIEHDFRPQSADAGGAGGGGGGDPARVVGRLDAVAGIGLYSMDFAFTSRNPALSPGVPFQSASNQFFAQPLLGVRGELQLLQDFTIDLRLTGGYWADSDRDSLSIDVQVGFMWRPVSWAAAEIGWRQIAYDFNDGDGAQKFEYDGAVAGVFAGLVLRF